MKPDPAPSLDVLIVEDEPIVAQDLAFIIEDMGHRVWGPFRSVAETLVYLDGRLPDVALLDVNVADGQVYPVADLMQAGAVPIVFCSAHALAQELGARYPQSRTVSKPYNESAIQAAVAP